MDRRSVVALVLMGLAIVFFSSETYRKFLRQTFGLPEPAKQAAPAKSGAPGKDSAKAATAAVAADSARPDTLAAAPSDSARDTVAAPAPAKRTPIVVETEEFQVALSRVGGGIRSLQLKSVSDEKGLSPQILPPSVSGVLGLTVAGTALDEAVFAADSALPDTIRLEGKDSASIRLAWRDGGREVVRTYVFRGQGPKIGVAFAAKGFQSADYRYDWKTGIRPIEPPAPKVPFGAPPSNEFIFRDLEEVTHRTDKKEYSFSGKTTWLGLRSKYAMAVLLFPSARDGEGLVNPITDTTGGAGESYSWTFRTRSEDAGDQAELVVTPLRHGLLRSFGVDFERILFGGWALFFRADLWFPGLCAFILWLLNAFYKLLPNYGVAIILLTLTARLSMFPLTIKQVKQSKRMAEVMPLLKPRLEEIKQQHKSDPRKMQEETMKAYAEMGVNPFAALTGCLPLLLQMPVFIALYSVLGRAIELRGEPFAFWITDLAMPDVLLPWFKVPFLFPMGLTILPILMAGTMFWLNKMTMKDPQMQAMVYIMPVMMLVFSTALPSGLLLYWIVSNLFSVAQTAITNAGPIPTPGLGAIPGTPAARGGKRGGPARKG